MFLIELLSPVSRLLSGYSSHYFIDPFGHILQFAIALSGEEWRQLTYFSPPKNRKVFAAALPAEPEGKQKYFTASSDKYKGLTSLKCGSRQDTAFQWT